MVAASKCDQNQFPPDDKTGALPTHFPSSSSFTSQVARLFLESKRPSSPLPMIVATVGFAAPFVKMGTLGYRSARSRHIHRATQNEPEQSPADLIGRLRASKLAGGVDLPVRIWLEFADEADKEPPDPASAVAGVLVAAGIEDECSPNLAAGIFDCKLVELLVEVCNGLVARSVRNGVTSNEPL